MIKQIKTAVFPVAGLGTRFLPVTKTGPKELLPIVDKPIIQYVVEEAIAAGCTKLVFVTSHTKRAIEDYFDVNVELEHTLALRGKQQQLDMVRHLVPTNVDIVYVRQRQPQGLGDAILCARAAVGDEPFVVLLPDDILVDHAALQKMVEHYCTTQTSVVAVETIPSEDSDKYGIVAVNEQMALQKIVEKPAPQDAPSNLAVIGRYVLSPKIFDYLAELQPGVGGEVQLTDAIAQLLQSEPVFAYPFTGKRYDCGHPLGYIKAILDFAMQRSELSSELRDHIKTLF